MPKLKPTLHNAFAIFSQPNNPTNYNMSSPPLQMDNNKTIIPPDPQEHRRQRKIARQQHIKQTLRRLHDSNNLFLDNCITLAEDEQTSLAKANDINKNKHVSFTTHKKVHQYFNNEQPIMVTYNSGADGHYISKKD